MDSHQSRERSRSFSDKYEFFLIGEQVRLEMYAAGLIKDRKYHFRTYKNCVSGYEAVDWLLHCHHCRCRSSAVQAMRMLQECEFLHHVCDDHQFKDEMLFYRFRKDDKSFEEFKDLNTFYKALKLYKMMTSQKFGILKNFQLNVLNGQIYHQSFSGAAFVDWIIRQKEALSKSEAINIGRLLLESDLIRHVTDDHHFRSDSSLLYQFTLDYEKRRKLSDILRVDRGNRLSMDSSISSVDSQDSQYIPGRKSPNSYQHDSHKEKLDNSYSNSYDFGRRQSSDFGNKSFFSPERRSSDFSNKSLDLSSSPDSSKETDESDDPASSPRSVLIRQASANELESSDTPYFKQHIRICSDSVGYGLVVRGDGPTYVQTVDPTGPAAAAGIKVRQYIYSVDGINVLRCNHKTVAKLILNDNPYSNLVVMTHKRDVSY